MAPDDAVPASPQPGVAGGFAGFGRLPPEIRQQIWRAGLPPPEAELNFFNFHAFPHDHHGANRATSPSWLYLDMRRLSIDDDDATVRAYDPSVWQARDALRATCREARDVCSLPPGESVPVVLTRPRRGLYIRAGDDQLRRLAHDGSAETPGAGRGPGCAPVEPVVRRTVHVARAGIMVCSGENCSLNVPLEEAPPDRHLDLRGEARRRIDSMCGGADTSADGDVGPGPISSDSDPFSLDDDDDDGDDSSLYDGWALDPEPRGLPRLPADWQYCCAVAMTDDIAFLRVVAFVSQLGVDMPGRGRAELECSLMEEPAITSEESSVPVLWFYKEPRATSEEGSSVPAMWLHHICGGIEPLRAEPSKVWFRAEPPMWLPEMELRWFCDRWGGRYAMLGHIAKPYPDFKWIRQLVKVGPDRNGLDKRYLRSAALVSPTKPAGKGQVGGR